MEKKAKILIVDPNEVNRLLLSKYLKDMDVNIKEGADGASLEKVSDDIDLIITANKLPKITGLAALLNLKRKILGKILFTTNDLSILSKDLKKEGIDIVRVPDCESLIKLVKEKLEGFC